MFRSSICFVEKLEAKFIGESIGTEIPIEENYWGGVKDLLTDSWEISLFLIAVIGLSAGELLNVYGTKLYSAFLIVTKFESNSKSKSPSLGFEIS